MENWEFTEYAIIQDDELFDTCATLTEAKEYIEDLIIDYPHSQFCIEKRARMYPRCKTILEW